MTMLDPLAPYVGGIAAFFASLFYVPQVRKASTGDISMLGALTLGLGL
jgi:MtN3 and saliva related transmembrane protein